MKTTIVIIALFILLGVGGFGCWAWNTAVNSGKGVIEKTVDPDNIIFNYEYFHDQYNSYLKLQSNALQAENAIKDFVNLAGERKNWTSDDRMEYQMLQTRLIGIINQINECASKYNSASSKLNVKIFKDRSLPYSLESYSIKN